MYYGNFFAEIKYWSDPEEHQRLVDNYDVDSVMKALTNETIEKKVLTSTTLKATVLGRELLSQHYHFGEEGCSTNDSISTALGASVVEIDNTISKEWPEEENFNKVFYLGLESVYKDTIAPLTKIIEVVKKLPKVRTNNVIDDVTSSRRMK